MKWYHVIVKRIGDRNGLMMIELKGKSLQDAKNKLADVLRLQAVQVDDKSWEEA